MEDREKFMEFSTNMGPFSGKDLPGLTLTPNAIDALRNMGREEMLVAVCGIVKSGLSEEFDIFREMSVRAIVMSVINEDLSETDIAIVKQNLA